MRLGGKLRPKVITKWGTKGGCKEKKKLPGKTRENRKTKKKGREQAIQGGLVHRLVEKMTADRGPIRSSTLQPGGNSKKGTEWKKTNGGVLSEKRERNLTKKKTKKTRHITKKKKGEEKESSGVKVVDR